MKQALFLVIFLLGSLLSGITIPEESNLKCAYLLDIERSSDVFIAEILAADSVEYGWMHELKVLKVYKGEQQENDTVQFMLHANRYRSDAYNPGATLALYLNTQKEGVYYHNRCSVTHPIEKDSIPTYQPIDLNR